MNGVNHAVTALVIKRFWPEVPIIPVLISVQIIDFLWVAFNIFGIEYTKFEPNVRSLADIHFIHMPFSHSILFSFIWAGIVWFMVSKIFNRPTWGLPLALGVMSHIVLDIATHTGDIEFIPFLGLAEIGSGAYSVPIIALAIELLYCVFCWWIFTGNYSTLAWLIMLNFISLSIYIPQIIGAETVLSTYPHIFAPIIGAHTLFGIIMVWWLYNREQKITDNKE